MQRKERFMGCLTGLAVGDAVGTTLEFKPRGSFEPITDMVGGGPFNLKKGQWTDDTSMALCLAESLIEKEGTDLFNQLDKYVAWMVDGHNSSTGVLFDIGHTTRSAIENYLHTKDPHSGSRAEMDSGNGSIMRLAPVPMYYNSDIDVAVLHSIESSKTTHGSRSCQQCCGIMAYQLFKLLNGAELEEILDVSSEVQGLLDRFTRTANLKKEIESIAKGEFMDKTIDDIKGSGYVVESLEASLWCLYNTDNYRDAILMASNLGDDADTTAAIVGQYAGAYYGINGIPKDWVESITFKDKIINLSLELMQ